MGPGHSSLRQTVLGLSTLQPGLVLSPWHELDRLGVVPWHKAGRFEAVPLA